MKLSGWQRLGIVVSVVWAMGVFGTAIYQHSYSSSHESALLVAWDDMKPKPWEIDWQNEPPKVGDVFDPDEYLRSKGMSQEEINALSAQPSFKWLSIILVAFAPPIIFAFLFFIIRSAFLWVYAGFKKAS